MQFCKYYYVHVCYISLNLHMHCTVKSVWFYISCSFFYSSVAVRAIPLVPRSLRSFQLLLHVAFHNDDNMNATFAATIEMCHKKETYMAKYNKT